MLRKTKTGEFIIYAFLLFKQPYVPHIYVYIYQTCHRQRYTHYFIDMREATRFLSENNVSGDIDQIHHHSMRPLLSLFRRYFLASPGTNAVCTTTLVTRDIDTRVGGGSTTGRRVNVPRCVAREGGEGVESLIDPLLREYFFPPFLFLFSFIFSLFFSYHTHAATSSAPTFCPSSPLFGLCASVSFFFFPFSFSLPTVSRIFEAERERGMKNNACDLKCLTR